MTKNLLTALAISAGLAAPTLTPHALAFDIDLREVDSPQAALATAFAPARYATVEMNESVRMLALPVGGELVDLELERFNVWTDDAVFIIDNVERTKPEITLLRGSVVGKDGSLVVVGIGAHATNGFIEMDGTTYSISSGGVLHANPENANAQNFNNQNELLITDLADLRLDEARPTCAIDEGNFVDFAPLGQPVYDDATLEQFDTNTRGTLPCRVVRVAIDSDYEWTQERFGGNPFAAAEYSLFLMVAVSEIYQRDLNVRLVVRQLVLTRFVMRFDQRNAPGVGPAFRIRQVFEPTQRHRDRPLLLGPPQIDRHEVAALRRVRRHVFRSGMDRVGAFEDDDAVVLSELPSEFGVSGVNGKPLRGARAPHTIR